MINRNMLKMLTLMVLCLMPAGARAEFIISTAILEFTDSGPRQKDIELINNSEQDDYIVSEVSEIINPGLADERRVVIEDPEHSGLLVTPNKTILAAGNRKVLRFVLLKEPDGKEHIYRVAIRPVIKGVESESQIGLKVLVGYEALVIVRPKVTATSYTAARRGKSFMVTNNGNTNVLFQNGSQCPKEAKCALPPVVRVYPGQTASADLPLDKNVSYSVWDGKEVSDRSF